MLTNKFTELREKGFENKAISIHEAKELLELKDATQILSLSATTRALSDKQMGRKINFYYTSRYFPALSVTGSECALRCKHCQTKLLQNLTAAPSPTKLVEICEKLAKKGAKGVLITGGCLPSGKVPLGNFLDAISSVKKKTNLIVIAHTGIVDFQEAEKLASTGLDGAAVDVVGSPETTKAVYGIEIKPKTYTRTLKALEKAKIPIISPHVCVGLNFGNLKHELTSLEIISGIKPTTVVITALMPLRGTPLEKVTVNPYDVAKVVSVSRLMFPNVPITLGCARSKGADRALIEKLAIQAGVTSIATPSDFALKQSESIGLTTESYAVCCAVPPASYLRLTSTEEP
ncbi:MAG: radical SAM protein [Candidatus Bathyarchaeia archaeon]